MFRSFAVYDVFLVQLALALIFLLSSLTEAARGAPTNATIRFDSPLVSFSPGWSVAEFNGTGTEDKFAFATLPGEELVVRLPRKCIVSITHLRDWNALMSWARTDDEDDRNGRFLQRTSRLCIIRDSRAAAGFFGSLAWIAIRVLP